MDGRLSDWPTPHPRRQSPLRNREGLEAPENVGSPRLIEGLDQWDGMLLIQSHLRLKRLDSLKE